MSMHGARRQSWRVVAPAGLLVAGLLAPGARAEPPARRPLAETCFEAAEAAQPLLKTHKLVAAQRELLLCAREGCPRAARTDCQTWLDQLTEKLPTVVFRARESRAGGDVAVDDVRVSADGEVLVSDRLGETPVALDPGAHTLTFEHGGFPPIEQRIELHEGESRRLVDVVFRSAQAGGGTATASSASGERPAQPPGGPDDASQPVPGIVWALLGGGAIALGVGVYFEAAGLSERSNLDSTCRSTSTCASSDVDSARGKVTAGDVTLGVSAALLAGAAYVYFTRPTAGPRRGADALRLQVGPVAGGLAVGLGGQL